ncbi:hypothetical protein GCM10027168_53790 [Streptomyces capparidis]
MNFSQLRKLKVSEFEDAADGWHKISTAAGSAKDKVENEIIAKLQEKLEGEGSSAAVERLRRLARNYHYIQVETGLLRTALNGLASELAAAQKKLNDAVADAEAEKMTVKDDGSVHYVSKSPQTPLLPNQSVQPGGPPSILAPQDSDPTRAKAEDIASRIGIALDEATDADTRYSRTISRLVADNDLEVSNSDWVDVKNDMGSLVQNAGDYMKASDIPKGKDPMDNYLWWTRLSEEERADYATLFPATIGAMDGLPAAVRDEANRTVLAETRADYANQLAGIPPEPAKYKMGSGGYPYATKSAEWIAWNEKYGDRKAHLEASVKGMDAIQKRIDATGRDGLPEAYVLGFDANKDGRAIIANGNPDTADHTAVYVPGTTSELGKIGGDINRMTDLWRTSNALAEDGKSVSTITWLGYDAPDDIVKDAPFKHYAYDGAPALNTFVDGLNASNNQGAGGQTTVIGHSYGTTVVGAAAKEGDLNADDVVFAGSPGVLVGRASDMDVPAGHVFNQEAWKDPVTTIGQAGMGHREWSWSSGMDFVTPDDDKFGARQMETDTIGHSDYWNYGSESLQNQAHVVVGQYDRITEPAYNDEGEPQLDPK